MTGYTNIYVLFQSLFLAGITQQGSQIGQLRKVDNTREARLDFGLSKILTGALSLRRYRLDVFSGERDRKEV